MKTDWVQLVMGNCLNEGQILLSQFSARLPSELRRCTINLNHAHGRRPWMFAAALKASAASETCSAAVFIRCGWPALPQTLTCSAPRCDSYLGYLFVCFSQSLISSFCLSPPLPRSQEAQAGPASKEYMSQCAGHQPGPAEPQLCLQCQRRQPG